MVLAHPRNVCIIIGRYICNHDIVAVFVTKITLQHRHVSINTSQFTGEVSACEMLHNSFRMARYAMSQCSKFKTQTILSFIHRTE